jgi:hypothetical protein
MIRDRSYQEGQHLPLPPVQKGAAKKMTNEISREIEALSLIDATFTNGEICRTILGRFDTTFGECTVCTKRKKLELHFRPPMVEQKLTCQLRHTRLQFALDLLLVVARTINNQASCGLAGMRQPTPQTGITPTMTRYPRSDVKSDGCGET